MSEEYKVLLVKVDGAYDRQDYDWNMPLIKATLIPEHIRSVNKEEYELLADFVHRHSEYVLVSLSTEDTPLYDVPKAIAEARKFKKAEEVRKEEYRLALEKKKADNAKKNVNKLLKQKEKIDAQLALVKK